MRRIRSACCARAANDHAAAAPTSVMNSRRLMPSMGFLPLKRVVRTEVGRQAPSCARPEW